MPEVYSLLSAVARGILSVFLSTFHFTRNGQVRFSDFP